MGPQAVKQDWLRSCLLSCSPVRLLSCSLAVGYLAICYVPIGPGSEVLPPLWHVLLNFGPASLPLGLPGPGSQNHEKPMVFLGFSWFWEPLGSYWGSLGPSSGHPGPNLVHLGTIWLNLSQCWSIIHQFWRIWAQFWSIFHQFWWIWAHIGIILFNIWSILAHSN